MNSLDDNLRVVARGLAGGGSIKVPVWKRSNGLALGSRKSTCLGAAVSISIDPDVFSQDLVDRETEGGVAIDDGGVKSRFSSRWSEDASHLEGGAAAGKRSSWAESGGTASGESKDGGSELHFDVVEIVCRSGDIGRLVELPTLRATHSRFWWH